MAANILLFCFNALKVYTYSYGLNHTLNLCTAAKLFQWSGCLLWVKKKLKLHAYSRQAVLHHMIITLILNHNLMLVWTWRFLYIHKPKHNIMVVSKGCMVTLWLNKRSNHWQFLTCFTHMKLKTWISKTWDERRRQHTEIYNFKTSQTMCPFWETEEW